MNISKATNWDYRKSGVFSINKVNNWRIEKENHFDLERVSKWHIEEEGFFKKGIFFYGADDCIRLSFHQYTTAKAKRNTDRAVKIGEVGERELWWTLDGLFFCDFGIEAKLVLDSIEQMSNNNLFEFKSFKFYDFVFSTSKKLLFRLTREKYNKTKMELNKSGIVKIGKKDKRDLWWTNDGLFWIDSDILGGSTIDIQSLLTLTGKTQSNSLNSYKSCMRCFFENTKNPKEDNFVIDHNQYEKAKDEIELYGASKIGKKKRKNLWWSMQGLFWVDTNQDDEEIQLLLWDRHRKHEAKLDRLRNIRASKVKLGEARRERISDEVRAFVWERDEGCCVKCGAQEDLQFDHIIPVAKGGGSSIGNIQVLCGECNRLKRDNIV